MTHRVNGIVSKAMALALATAPVLSALTIGALLDGHLSIAAAAANGDHGRGTGGGNSGGNGASGEHNGKGVSASDAGGGNGTRSDSGSSAEHGKSASKGDVDGDGTPGRSGTQGIGRDISEVAKDDSTTGHEKAGAIQTINHPKLIVDDEVSSSR